MPDLRESFGQIDAAAGVVGGFDGLLGWWGDAAVVVSKDADGSIGGGLLIQPTDARGRQADVRHPPQLPRPRRRQVRHRAARRRPRRRDDHGRSTSAAAVESSGGLPPGVKAELAYAVTDDVVVIGYGEAFVASVLDAGPGPSLADDSRFSDLVKRVGEENIGLSFVDIRAIRELVEPLVKDDGPGRRVGVLRAGDPARTSSRSTPSSRAPGSTATSIGSPRSSPSSRPAPAGSSPSQPRRRQQHRWQSESG